ncbi:uncharacterized protein LOC135370149 isoform X2 [Ornithodoros turicata]
MRFLAAFSCLLVWANAQQQYLPGPPPLGGGRGYQPQAQAQKAYQPQGYQPPAYQAQQAYSPQSAPQQSYSPPSQQSTTTPPPIVFDPAPLHYVSIGAKLEGDYKFGYDTGKSKDKTGSFREESRLPDGTVKGSYGYIDATGRQRIIRYTAGKEGFKAEGDIYQEGAPKDTIPKHLQNPPSTPAPAQASSAAGAGYAAPQYGAPQQPQYQPRAAPSFPQYQPRSAPSLPQYQPRAAPSAPQYQPRPSAAAPSPNFASSNLAFPQFFQNLNLNQPAAAAAPAPRPAAPAQQPSSYSPFQVPPAARSAPQSYVPQYTPRPQSPYGGLQQPAATQQRPSFPQFQPNSPALRSPYDRPAVPPAYAQQVASAQQRVPQFASQAPKFNVPSLFGQEANKAGTKPNYQDFLKQFIPFQKQQPAPAGSPAGAAPYSQAPPQQAPFARPQSFPQFGQPSAAPAQQALPPYLQNQGRPAAPPQFSQPQQAAGGAPQYSSYRPPLQVPQQALQQGAFGGAAAKPAKKVEDGTYDASLYDHGLYDPKKYEDPYFGKTSSAAAPAQGLTAAAAAPQGYAPQQQGQQQARSLPAFDTSLLSYNIG